MTTTAEALLALRAPGADWLATLITALEESRRDPEFDNHLRKVFADLASVDELPGAVLAAAHRRTQDFTRRLTEDFDAMEFEEEVVTQRPKLTLVGG